MGHTKLLPSRITIVVHTLDKTNHDVRVRSGQASRQPRKSRTTVMTTMVDFCLNPRMGLLMVW